MPLLKLVLTGLLAVFAVIAGLFIAAVAAIMSVIFFLLGRPRVVRTWKRNVPSFHPKETRAPNPGAPEAIDVIATEVPVDGSSR